jgi:hypothetical protein
MRATPLRLALATLLSATLAGCASLPASCPAPGKPALWAQLAFGRAIGDQGVVSEEAFQAFVDTEVTPRFPDGLTIVDARGQWRGADGRIVREPSKILMLALPPGEGLGKLEAVGEAYKRAFRQEAVMLLTQPACLAF